METSLLGHRVSYGRPRETLRLLPLLEERPTLREEPPLLRPLEILRDDVDARGACTERLGLDE